MKLKNNALLEFLSTATMTTALVATATLMASTTLAAASTTLASAACLAAVSTTIVLTHATTIAIIALMARISTLWLSLTTLIAMIDLRRIVVAAVVTIAMILRAVVLVRIAVVVDAIVMAVITIAAHSTEIMTSMIVHVRRAMDDHRSAMDLMMMAATVVVVVVVDVRVSTTVATVDGRRIEIEERAVAVDRVDAECPAATRAVDRAIEVIERDEAGILAGIEHEAEILIAVVEQAVVLIDGIVIAIHHIVHDTVNGVDEIEVDLIAVIVLHRSQVEFVGHAVAQEACIGANVAHRHCEHLSGHSQQNHG